MHRVFAEHFLGQGRVVALADVDILSNDTLSDGDGIENDNDRFLANLIAYLGDEAGETFFLNPGLNGNWWNGPARAGEGLQFELVYPSGDLSSMMHIELNPNPAYQDQGYSTLEYDLIRLNPPAAPCPIPNPPPLL